MKENKLIHLSLSYFILFGTLICLLLLIACSTGHVAKKPAEFKIIETTLSKGIVNRGGKVKPVNQSSIFTTDDAEIIATAKFKNLTKPRDFRWKWYDPNGKLYFDTRNYTVRPSNKKFIKDGVTWHKISVKGEKPQHYTGRWNVNLYDNNALISSKSFEIIPNLKTVGRPPMLSIKKIAFSRNVLEGGENAELSITLKNTGSGEAKDVFLEIESNTNEIRFNRKIQVPVIASRGGIKTVKVPVSGDVKLQNGDAFIDINVVEPHFNIKIKGKRVAFQTRKFRRPELILAKFSAVEKESASPNSRIDKNEVFILKIAVQNVGKRAAENIRINVKNSQKGVLPLSITDNKRVPYAKIKKIESGSYKILEFEYYVNSAFNDTDLKFSVTADEQFGKYGFSEEKLVAINTKLTPEGEGYIRNVAAVDPEVGTGVVVIQDIPVFGIDVDVNIPETSANNPDAVAVVIGNRNYKNKDVPAVKFAYRDASTVKQYLVKTLGYREQNIIYKTDATRADFNDLFGVPGNPKGILHNYIKPGKSDVFIYYSGHGAPDMDTQRGYFVPVDCHPNRLALNGYALDLFYKNLSELDTKSVSVVLDACFSGGTNTGKSLIGSASPFGIKVNNPLIANNNTVCLTSSKGDEISSWYNSKKHGLFTYFFLKALQGDADKNKDKKLTFSEIYTFVSDKHDGVPYWARRLHGGRTQTPMLQGEKMKNTVLVRYN